MVRSAHFHRKYTQKAQRGLQIYQNQRHLVNNCEL